MVARRLHLCAALACLSALPAMAADRSVHLRPPPPLGKDIAAMPLIVDPADEAEQRINAALQRLDGKVRKSIADCRKHAGENFDWSRAVDAPMRGPGFLSLVATDDAFCGGAHPFNAVTAIVYDLRTGDPVDWTHLLPPSLTGKVELIGGADEVKTVTLSSPRLYGLFLAGYDATGADADCKEAVRSAGSFGPPGMAAWLDGKRAGLVLHVSLAHVFQSCEDREVVPLATLEAEGARPTLIEALEAARPK